MRNSVKPYKDSQDKKKQQVRAMFDNISSNYDGLNRVISFGIDQSWRKKVIKTVTDSKAKSVIDIATGTGDLAIALAKAKVDKVIGIDISKGMLDVGRKKIEVQSLSDKIDMVQADSENLPYEDDIFDAATVAFGVRNFEDLDKGLSEIYRVLKPGGVFVVLETSNPTKFPFKQGYFVYTKYILPLIGKFFSKDKSAYRYLSESASVFPFGVAFNNILKKNGFKDVKDFPQTFGVSTIYKATK